MHAGFWLLDRRAGVMRCAAMTPGGSEDDAFVRLSGELALAWGVGLPGRAWAAAAPVHVPSLSEDVNLVRGVPAREAGAAAAYAVPVLREDAVVGVVEVFLAEGGTLEEAMAQEVAAVAARLGGEPDVEAALSGPPARASVERELQRRAAQQAAVAEFGRQALAGPDPDALLDQAVRLLAASLNVRQAALVMREGEEKRLVVRAGTGWAEGTVGETLPPGRRSLAGYALMRGESIVVDDLAAETRFDVVEALKKHRLASSAAVIVRGPSKPVGILAAHSPERARFDSEDVHFMTTVANVIAAALVRTGIEEDLRRANALLEGIVTGASDAIFVKDASGRFLFLNEAAARVTGRPVEQVVGRRSTEIFPTGAELEAEDREVLRTGASKTFEEEMVVDGERRWFSTTKGPYRDGAGNVVGVIGIGRDVTAARLAERRTHVLAGAARLLASGTDLEATLAEIARIPVPAIADIAEVTVVGSDGQPRSVAMAARDEDLTRAIRRLRTAYPTDPRDDAGIAAVLRTGEPLLLQELTPEKTAAFARDETHRRMLAEIPFTSAVVLPLTARSRTFGTLTLATVAGRPELDEADADLAAELAARVALAADNTRLYAERQSILRTLESGLLPPELPDIPGIEMAVAFHAGREGLEVGGDFYDVVPSGNGWLVVVGDVCGRGAEAASVTAVARHTLRGAAHYDDDPASLLTTLNRAMLRERLQLRFCTVICVHLTRREDGFEVRMANGGHPPPVLSRADGAAETVRAAGTLVGALEQPHFGTASVHVGPGDALVLYTDGLLDASRGGDARRSLRPKELAPSIAAAAPAGARSIVSALASDAVAAAGRGGLADDVAILAIRVEPAGRAGG